MAHGWFDSNYKFRCALTLDCDVDASDTGPYDYDIEIPKPFDLFWDNVLSNGYDMALCLGDGYTEIVTGASMASAWDRGASWSKSSRTGSIRIDGAQVGAGKPLPNDGELNCVWLYWGYAAETADHTFGTVSLGSTENGWCNIDAELHSTPRWKTAPERVGAATVERRITKTDAETLFVYADMRHEVLRRRGKNKGKQLADAIESFTWISQDNGSPTTVATSAEGQFVGASGAVLRLPITGGTAGEIHSCELVTTWSSGRTLDRRILVEILNPTEP